ncbi:hypothetical protein MY480_14300 [Leptospira borgpetersenii]|nr:hypothetical protein MY480_14300 [Leptospira borgpetersenii]
MLSQLREQYPQSCSFLMNLKTFVKFGTFRWTLRLLLNLRNRNSSLDWNTKLGDI